MKYVSHILEVLHMTKKCLSSFCAYRGIVNDVGQKVLMNFFRDNYTAFNIQMMLSIKLVEADDNKDKTYYVCGIYSGSNNFYSNFIILLNYHFLKMKQLF